jgi:hypothetical protein
MAIREYRHVKAWKPDVSFLVQPAIMYKKLPVKDPIRAKLRTVQQLLLILLFVLIFEGILRKMLPGVLGVALFFAKDALCLLLWGFIFQIPKPPVIQKFVNALIFLTLFILPVFFATLIKDVSLAVFGLKQYLLFTVVALAVFVCYEGEGRSGLSKLMGLLSGSILITSGVALVQSRLPTDHWLNLSVAGESLEAFRSSERLRVGSTFPFVAQYAMYLNAGAFFLPVFFLMRQKAAGWARIFAISLVPAFVVGMFITGSRSSVLGNMAIFGVATGLIVLRHGGKSILVLAASGIVAVGGSFVARELMPDAFLVYAERSAGSLEQTHAEEMEERIVTGLLGWTKDIEDTPLLGNGIGLMSNGVDRLSDYAAVVRSTGFWTETDQATVLYEGGMYLFIVWYFFRLWIIFSTLGMVLKMKDRSLSMPASCAWGYVLVIGITGTLSIHPPISIWWWLAVGLIYCLKSYGEELQDPIPASPTQFTRKPTGRFLLPAAR